MNTTIQNLVRDINNAVTAKDETLARQLHKELSAIAKTPEERTLVHDIGNLLQRLIFENYLKEA